MDHRAIQRALGLTSAGASMLIAGAALWMFAAVGQVTSGLAARDLRLTALALLAGGAVCGLAMGLALATGLALTAGGRGSRPPVPAGASGLTGEVPGSPGPALTLDDPRTLMNPPPPSPPPLAPPPPRGTRPAGPQPAGPRPAGDREPAPRVWWRAAQGPVSSWDDDNSEEWLRSLRGPAIQQPPPHSAE